MKKLTVELSEYEYRYILDLKDKGDRLSEGDLSWVGDCILSAMNG